MTNATSGRSGEADPSQHRDLELLREILLQVRAAPPGPRQVELDIPDRQPEVVSYHVQLLHEAGYVRAVDATTSGNYEWLPVQLTYLGHEFLGATEDSGAWHAVRQKALEYGALPLEVAKAVAVGYLKDQLGLE